MNFEHQQAAHCESGVMSSLLTHHGLKISEPMAFGLANALAFAYIPLVKLAGQPLIAYRLPPKFIIKSLSKRLGVEIQFEKFRDPLKGASKLEQEVSSGKLLGLQTSVFWLPYFPDEMRFHFNAHNLLIYGYENNEYLVSDPVFEEPVKVTEKDLTKARFAKGPLAPNGLMYSIASIPDSIDYEKIIPKAISKNYKVMLGAPLPVIGVSGIHFLANKIRKLGKKHSKKEQRLFLGHIVRMQEEIGTGGAGFRFMYASFLEESGKLLGDDRLINASQAMTDTGDQWRQFALNIVQQCKSKDTIDLEYIAASLDSCGQKEKEVWRELKAWKKSL